MSSNEDDDLTNKPPSFLASSASTTLAVTVPKRKLTKKRRTAIANGTLIGADRKNGQTDFTGIRKEVMDAHLAKYPRNGTRHPASHRAELNDAFDARIPWRLEWHQEPPSDHAEFAFHEQALKAQHDEFNHKLRNFYDRQGTSTGGTKSVFKKVVQQIIAPVGKAPHRCAEHQHYAMLPKYRAKVLRAFNDKCPDATALGRKRVNAYSSVALELFRQETEDVKALVRTDLETKHARKLGEYKARVAGKQGQLNDLTEEQHVGVREHFDEAVVPLLDQLQAASGFSLALHAGHIRSEEGGKAKMDLRSLFSGLGPASEPYKNYKLADPQRSAQMAQHWTRHVFNMYEIENADSTRTREDARASTPELSAPISPTPTPSHMTRRSAARQAISGPSRASGSGRGAADAREDDDDGDNKDDNGPVMHVSSDVRRRAILGAVEVCKARIMEHVKPEHQYTPPECKNKVLIGWKELEDVLMALRGVDPDLLELSQHISFPRHEPTIDIEQFDDPPAMRLSEYHNEIRPLVRAWICNPDLDIHERRAFVDRTHKMGPAELAAEEERLEDRRVWMAVKRKAKKVGDGKRRKRKKGPESSDDKYASDEDGGRGAAGTRKKARKTKKTPEESSPVKRLDLAALAKSKGKGKPRPKPKSKLKLKKVAFAEQPQIMELEAAGADEQLMSEVEDETTLNEEDETLEAWVRRNPNLVDEDFAATLRNDYDVDGEFSAFVMGDIQSEVDESGLDGLNVSKEMSKQVVGKPDVSRQSASDEVVAVDESAPAGHKHTRPKRAAKEKAVMELSELYDKYPTPAPARKTEVKLVATTSNPTRMPRTQDESSEHGLPMHYKHLKNRDWAKEGKTWLLGLEGGGEHWGSLVKTWYKFQKKFDFREPEGTRPAFVFSTEKRPAAVGNWIGVARPLKIIPCIKKLATAEAIDEFGTSVRAWWRAINPKWRSGPNKTLVMTGEHDDWVSLFWPGPNGFFAVLACLFWWGTKMQGAPKDTGRWLRFVQDVEWVIGQITRNVLAKMDV
uniref:Uncharacterized protein n=1 Tax=Mycena chlorophos TaxID=658473 RepID=A0ABQ0LHS2_MYCCL|nr:predicted protein [Mycena chlorophos]